LRIPACGSPCGFAISAGTSARGRRRALSARLDAPLFDSGSSRLVVDFNRPRDNRALIDLPLVFHPAATGARWSFTPVGAG
jgi:hypothetical protein